MRLVTIAALSAVSLAALSVLSPAEAQAPRRYSSNTETIVVIDQYGHRTTRITVRPRSFLDPGNEVTRAYERRYTDYYAPPQTYPGEYFLFRNDPRFSYSRMPFPTCSDLPGFCR